VLIVADNKLAQAKCECKACTHKENADINATKNMLAVEHRRLKDSCAISTCKVNALVITMKQELIGNCEGILP